MNKKYSQKLILIIFSVLLPLFLLLFSYKTALYFADLTAEQKDTINFLVNKEQRIEGLDLKYTELELSHLLDVKRIMKVLNVAFYFLLAILTLILTYCRKDKDLTIKLLKYGGITTIAVESLLLVLILVSFNYSFTAFHYLFFPQGNWMFPAESWLIQTFPEQFFIKLSKTIFFQAFLGGMIFILLSLYLKNESVRN